MPRLSCWSCGRQIYTVAPLEALFLEERRCPRCGAFLNSDRRETERRVDHRRKNPRDDPGPPSPTGRPKPATSPKASTRAVGKDGMVAGEPSPKPSPKPAAKAKVNTAEDAERRLAERRTQRRRTTATS